MHFYGKTSSVRYTNENHIAAVFVQSVFTDYSTRAANLIASEWSYKNQNSSYGVNFRAGIFDRVIRVRVKEVLPF